jgi:WD40 repeat protein
MAAILASMPHYLRQTSDRMVLLALLLAVAGAGLVAHARPPTEADKVPARVDVAGDPLPDDALARLGTLRFRHGGRIETLAFTPDGKQIVSHERGGQIRNWDVATGREVGHIDDRMFSAVLTPDGEMIVTADWGAPDAYKVQLRRRSNLKTVREFPCDLSELRISPDGKLLAGVAAKGLPIEIWSLSEGKRLHSFSQHFADSPWHSFTFSPDSKMLVTGNSDMTVRFWDVLTGKNVRELRTSTAIGLLVLSADGDLLVTVGTTRPNAATLVLDNKAHVWSVSAGKEIQQLTMPVEKNADGYFKGIYLMAFAPDGKTLVTVGADQWLRFWEPRTGKEVRRISLAREAFLSAIAFSADGKILALGSGAIRLLDPTSGREISERLPGHRHSVLSIALTPDDQTIATGGLGDILLWDSRTGRQRGQVEGMGPLFWQVRSLRHCPTLVRVDEDKTIRLTDANTGKQLRRFRNERSHGEIMDVSHDDKVLALKGHP